MWKVISDSNHYLAPPNFIQLKLSKLKIASLLSLLLAAFIVIRWFYHIDLYSVNLMYWDQLGFYSVIFENGSLWDIFKYQHGPHRQGVGFVLTSFIDNWSDWNTRYIAFTIGILLLLTSFVALWLKRRLYGTVNSIDVVLLLICLSPVQYGLYTYTPNLSHGSMPLFLLILYCLCWTIKGCWRLIPICVLNFALIFTGFGLFAGFITPVILLIDLIKGREKVSFERLYLFLSLVISVLSLIYFFIDYNHDPAKPDWSWSIGTFSDLVMFLLGSISNFWSFQHLHLPQLSIAALSLIILIAVLFSNLKAYWKNPGSVENKLIFILIGFSLLFLFGMSIGRFSYGIGGAGASRYTTYLIPGFIGLYLYLSKVAVHPLPKLLFLVIFLFPNFHTRHLTAKMERLSQQKTQWVEVYLENEDWKRTNKITGFRIHPKPSKVELDKRLIYLKERKLNLYSQQSGE